MYKPTYPPSITFLHVSEKLAFTRQTKRLDSSKQSLKRHRVNNISSIPLGNFIFVLVIVCVLFKICMLH